jgi:hypothetical protein
MPSQPTCDEIAKLIVTREPAARMLDLHVSQFDRLFAQGLIRAITNEHGRAIGFLRKDVMELASGSYRRKPGPKTKAKREKEVA